MAIKKNILLINAYSYKNLGDSGIVIAMSKFLRKKYPDCIIKLMSSNHKENSEFYSDYGIECVPAPWPIGPNISLFSKYITGAYIFIKSLVKPKSETFLYFWESDITISVGGGYLYSSRKGPLGVGLVNSLFNYWLAARFSPVSVGFPQSLGPFNFWVDKYLTKCVLKKVDRIYARETYSSNLDSILTNSKVLPDIALNYRIQDIKPCNRERKSDEVLQVGITVLDWRFASAKSDESTIEKYLDKISIVIESMSKDYVLKVNVYPQVEVGKGDSDLKVSKILKQKMLYRNINCEVFSIKGFNHDQIIKEYSKCDLFIASRMHSSIFAIDGGVPTIALAYQPKTKGTMEAAGLGNQCFDIDNFSEYQLKSCIDEILGISCKYIYPENLLSEDMDSFA